MTVWHQRLGAATLYLAASVVQGGTVVGTPHDLAARAAGAEDQLCVYCHTRHSVTAARPLWNHEKSPAGYTLYASSAMNFAPIQPGAVSKLCLSCHDGTVGLLNYGGRAVGATAADVYSVLHGQNGNTVIGRGANLSNDHPIGFTYDSALATADRGLVTPASDELVVAGVPLFESKLECSTCHNPHDNTLGGFLRISKAASTLCLKCHSNK